LRSARLTAAPSIAHLKIIQHHPTNRQYVVHIAGPGPGQAPGTPQCAANGAWTLFNQAELAGDRGFADIGPFRDCAVFGGRPNAG
jgi:hypothetical protein